MASIEKHTHGERWFNGLIIVTHVEPTDGTKGLSFGLTSNGVITQERPPSDEPVVVTIPGNVTATGIMFFDLAVPREASSCFETDENRVVYEAIQGLHFYAPWPAKMNILYIDGDFCDVTTDPPVLKRVL